MLTGLFHLEYPGMPPPLENLPGWALWLAQDADGAWWAYEAEPHQHDSGWYENEVGRCARLLLDTPNAAWRRTLKRVS
jgi:hypothetical protein